MIDPSLPTPSIARAGDLALLVGHNHKYYLLRLTPGGKLQTHRGELLHDNLIGQPWGSIIKSHINRTFFLLEPTLAELLDALPRRTQIMYAKDIGFILVSMGIGAGRRVIEAGSGSGGFTTALAHTVGPTGHVYSYEKVPDFQDIARRNIEKVGYQERVTFKHRDIAEGFDERDVDSIFLDVPNPYDYLPQVRAALKAGGTFGSLLPTTNQVMLLLKALHAYSFAFVDVCEIFLRYYKDDHTRFRPADRMVAHTGFLIFGRAVQEDARFEDAERAREDAEDPEPDA